MTLGMGMTEKQGGTDVRANTTTATPAAMATRSPATNGSCRRRCSDAFLVLAQAPGGLTCFLMPRFRPDGTVNALRFQRLKDKLGNRSNASSEVEFTDAFAWRVGDEGAGIRTIIQMVQLTRLDCAVASAGLMRMALAQAVHHCRHRKCLRQTPLIEQPMMRAVLADMALDVEGAQWRLSMRLVARARSCRDGSARGGLCTAADAGGEILDLQARARLHFRGDGMPRRQRLCRGKHSAAALSRGARSTRSGKAPAMSCASMFCGRSSGEGRNPNYWPVLRRGAGLAVDGGISTIRERSRGAASSVAARASGVHRRVERMRAVCDCRHILQNARRKNACRLLRRCGNRFTNS